MHVSLLETTTNDLEFDAILLYQHYLDRFSIDLDTEANFIASNTATAARVVAIHVEYI
jgi:hypothetical protein